MRFFLFDGLIIIATEDDKVVGKINAEQLYISEYGEYSHIEEIKDDYVVGTNSNYNIGGYDEVILLHVLDENKELPYIVDVDLIG